MAQELQILISAKDHIVTVRIIGEAHFDLQVADNHLDSILAHNPRLVIIDATQLSFLSSVGMCLLLNLKRAVTKAGGSVRIAGLQPLVRDALHHAMLLPLFETHPDLPSALAAK